MFHVDHHAADFIVGDLFSQAVGLLLRGQFAHGYIPGPIREQDDERVNVGVQDAFLLNHFMRHVKPCRKRRFPTHRDVSQGALGELDRVCRRQDQRGAIFLEHDQPDPVATLVCVCEQRKDRPFGRGHALGDCHRPGGIDHKQDQVGRLLDPHLALEVTRPDREGDLF